MNIDLTFYKMSGSGNDFIFLVRQEIALEAWPAQRIADLCDRRDGVGADGMVFLEPADGSRFRMTYFNADGSRAGMCGNAALCCARLIHHLGLAVGAGVQLETDSGTVETRCVGQGWMAELKLPNFPAPEAVDYHWLGAGERRMATVAAGVPHVVVQVDEVEAVDVAVRGRALRLDPEFGPGGTNVNFVGPDRKDPECRWQMRTYERGVEAETLACGTGTVAVAAALARWGEDELPVRIRSRGGRVFSVSGTLDADRVMEPWLCGEGRLVFTGVISAGF